MTIRERVQWAVTKLKLHRAWHHVKKIFQPRHTVAKIVWLAVVGFIAVVLSTGLLAYFMPIPSPVIVKQVIQLIPFPAAVVDGTGISLYDWQFEFLGWKQAAEVQGSATLESQMREDVLKKMMTDVLVYQIAKQYNIKVTDEELQKEVDNIQSQMAAGEKFTDKVQELFGWDVDTFKRIVMKPVVLRKKLSDELLNTDAAKNETKKRAEQIAKRVKRAASFEEVATEVSDDAATKAKGGDVGTVNRGILPKAVEDAAFGMAVNTVSDSIEADGVFYLIRVDSKTPANEEKGVPEQITAHWIVIKPQSFEALLDQQLKDARVYRFISYTSKNLLGKDVSR